MRRLITFGIAVILAVPIFAGASEEGMPGMSLIAPKRTYSVPSKEAGEDLLDQRGYGSQESMVRMMNLMMVGGSGYEGMVMDSMKIASADQKQPPGPKEGSDSMEGMASMPASPSPVEAHTAIFDIQSQITPANPIVGTNEIEITVQNKNTRKPVTGLKLKVQVFMTSMDMGTEEPRVKEMAPGKYHVQVAFAMKGPWAVKIFLPEGGEKILNFEVGRTK